MRGLRACYMKYAKILCDESEKGDGHCIKAAVLGVSFLRRNRTGAASLHRAAPEIRTHPLTVSSSCAVERPTWKTAAGSRRNLSLWAFEQVSLRAPAERVRRRKVQDLPRTPSLH
jgi:hypothetical protein